MSKNCCQTKNTKLLKTRKSSLEVLSLLELSLYITTTPQLYTGNASTPKQSNIFEEETQKQPIESTIENQEEKKLAPQPAKIIPANPKKEDSFDFEMPDILHDIKKETTVNSATFAQTLLIDENDFVSPNKFTRDTKYEGQYGSTLIIEEPITTADPKIKEPLKETKPLKQIIEYNPKPVVTNHIKPNNEISSSPDKINPSPQFSPNQLLQSPGSKVGDKAKQDSSNKSFEYNSNKN
jgi:hypothetical protein